MAQVKSLEIRGRSVFLGEREIRFDEHGVSERLPEETAMKIASLPGYYLVGEEGDRPDPRLVAEPVELTEMRDLVEIVRAEAEAQHLRADALEAENARLKARLQKAAGKAGRSAADAPPEDGSAPVEPAAGEDK